MNRAMNAPSFRTSNFVHDKHLKNRGAGKCSKCTNYEQSASGETHVSQTVAARRVIKRQHKNMFNGAGLSKPIESRIAFCESCQRDVPKFCHLPAASIPTAGGIQSRVNRIALP